MDLAVFGHALGSGGATCRGCGWTGGRDELVVELCAEVLDHRCPRCDYIVELVMPPTHDDVREAVAQGVAEAIEAYLPLSVPDRIVRRGAARLTSPDELPPLPDGHEPTIVVGHVGSERASRGPWLAVMCGEHELWREPAFWEDVAAAKRILPVLWACYGDEVEAIVVSPAAREWLLGDRISLIPVLDALLVRPPLVRAATAR